MADRRYIFIFGYLAVFTFLVGCVGVEEGVRGSVEPGRDYSKELYLTATGTGASEPEARDRAVAELSRIFESTVESDTFDSVRSVISGGEEKLDSTIESMVRVTSMVELRGVEIGTGGRDENTGIYRATAFLERRKARRLWEADMGELDGRIAAEVELARASAGSGVERYRGLRRAMSIWIEREVVASRLRVLGYGAGASPYDMAETYKELAQTKAALAFYFDTKGEGRAVVAEIIADELGRRGFAVAPTITGASAVVRVTVRVEPVRLDNPGWEFARAFVTLSVEDSSTGLIVIEVSEKKRAGHVNYDEAVDKALTKAAKAVAAAFTERIDEAE